MPWWWRWWLSLWLLNETFSLFGDFIIVVDDDDDDDESMALLLCWGDFTRWCLSFIIMVATDDDDMAEVMEKVSNNLSRMSGDPALWFKKDAILSYVINNK